MSPAAAQRYLVTGLLTALPLWLTWVIFEFILRQLSSLGTPWVRGLSRQLDRFAPGLAEFLVQPWVLFLLAVISTIAALMLLGWATQMVLGKRLLAAVEAFIERIPLVETIYGASKKLLSALQQKPEGAERVVLIPFPNRQMKTVGLVTRVMRDASTGKDYAAVYVPTTPNPTSGYLEIVPVEVLVPTDWSLDEAMTFIISGGAVAPERFRYGEREPEVQPGSAASVDPLPGAEAAADQRQGEAGR